MTSKFLKLTRHTSLPLAAFVASAAVLTVGCSNMETTATTTSADFASAGQTKGQVHGGNQPVSGATVQLYTVGFGNGTSFGPGNNAGVLLATTTTDARGNFGFSKQTSGTFPNTGNQYVCPTTGADAILYIKTTGGNTTGNGVAGVNNSAAVFLAPIGVCANAGSQFVNISEVTTAASVVALGQYINPGTEMIGADGIAVAYQAVLNAMKLVSTLVNQQTGLANPSVNLAGSPSGLNVSNLTMIAAPEYQKLNTIANILSACVNQASSTSASGCSTLFTNAVAPSTAAIARSGQPNSTFPAAADTLQAALYMFINPTDSSVAARTALYNLSPANGAPYQPTITSLPTDWTIAVSYTNYGVCAGTQTNFFNFPSDLSNDGNGNIWISNNATGGSLVEISNTGVPTSCATIGAKGLAGGTIDNEGNVWIGDSSANFIYRLVAPGSTQIAAGYPVYSVRAYTTVGPVLAITADGADNIYFTTVVNGTGQVYKITSGANISGINSPTAIAANVGPSPQHIFPDKVGDLFVTSGAGYVTELSTSTATSAVNGYVPTQFTVPSPSYGVVVGPSNRVYVTSADPGASLSVLAPQANGNGYSVLFSTSANTGGLSNPYGVWIDGGQTSFAANNTANSSNGQYALSLVAVDGTEVSASGNINGGYQKGTGYFNKMRNILVDQSGNAWITNDGNAYSVTEVIGVGAPIYGGYAAGLQNGRFQTLN